MKSVQISIVSLLLVSVIAVCGVSAIAQAQDAIVHVNVERDWPSNDPEDGESWTTAFRFLQDGLADALDKVSDPEIDEVDIWVAAGVYKPDHDSNNPTGSCQDFGGGWFNCTTTATFTIPSNVRIFGGFVGTESSLDERNGGVHDPTLTILTGDLADGASGPDFVDLAYSTNVVTFANTDSTARLDTVTIKSGWTATVLIDNSSAILSNAIITTSATTGVNVKGNAIPRLMNCQFVENQGVEEWSVPEGALTIETGAEAIVVNSLFYNNHSDSDGGAVHVKGQSGACPGTCPDTNVTLINCTIVGKIGTGFNFITSTSSPMPGRGCSTAPSSVQHPRARIGAATRTASSATARLNRPRTTHSTLMTALPCIASMSDGPAY